jgi:hypothetical protein
MRHPHDLTAALLGIVMVSMTMATPALAQTPIIESRSVVRIQAGALQGPAELLIQITGSAAGSETERPVAVDDHLDPKVTFGPAVEVLTGDPKRRIWRVPASVEKMSAAGLMLPRTAQITWQSKTIPTPYWVSNLATPVLSWKVDGLAGEWQIPSGCHPLRIAAAGTRATGIVVTSTLVEETTKQPLVGLFLAVGDTTRASAARLEAAINDTGEAVLLCMPSDPPPGTYSGLINVSAAEKPDGVPSAVKIHSTNWRVRSLGAAFLVLGCLLAFVFRVLVPARASQAQALLPATLLREQAEDHLKQIEGISAPETRAALTEVIASLHKQKLIDAGYITRSIPLPFGNAPDAAAYKTFLEGRGNLIVRLGMIADGLVAATKPGSSAPATAVDDLDELVPDVESMTIAALRAKIVTALTPTASGPGLSLAPDAPAEPTSRHLTILLGQLAAGIWLTWVVLTFAIGLGVLVLNDPGFGIPMDFVYCFLWGFGVPAAGQQLTTSSATTALNITLPSRG